LSARHTFFFRCIITLPLRTDLAIGLSIQGFLVLMLYVCVVCLLHAASALLLVVIVLTAHYRAPLCVVVSVLYIYYYQLYADCVHVET
jgi:hypothetical protein